MLIENIFKFYKFFLGDCRFYAVPCEGELDCSSMKVVDPIYFIFLSLL